MKLNELLSELSKQGVKLWADGDQLRIRAPKGVLTSKLRDSLVECKAELLLLLRRSSLMAIQPGGSKPPLFCVPPAATTALSFADLARHLGPDQPVYGLRPLGMDGEQASYTRVEDMAAHYIKEILTLQPEGPYFLGGRCFGGVVVFEMARQLNARGKKVALLAIFDYYAPGTRAPIHTPTWRKSPTYLVHRAVYHFQRRQLTKTILDFLIFRHMRRVKKKVVYIFSSPQDRRIQRVRNAHKMANSSYVAQVYSGRITFFSSSEWEAIESKRNQCLRWSELAAGGFDYHVVPGSHRSMLGEPHVRVLAEQLRSCLDEALADNSDVHHS